MFWNLFSSRKTHPLRRPAHARLQVEPLEDRTVLSTVVALTTNNRLLIFDSATPGVLTKNIPITGLVRGEVVLCIDFRPATGQLFGITNASRLLGINPNTGSANPVGTQRVPLRGGNALGIDFNPVTDRLRVISNSGLNLSVDPNNATATVETNLAYAPGDINFGRPPTVVSAAYTNNFPGATVTTLYDIDFQRNTVVRQGGINGTPSPDGGQLFTQGSLGVNTTSLVGFDIAPSGTAFASLKLPGRNFSFFYQVNVNTGATTLVGRIAGPIVRDIAVVLNNYSVHAVTSTNHLVRFNSDTPGTLDSNIPILGLQPTEQVVALDTRPATGELYALGLTGGDTGRVYRINPVTGQASQVGAGPFITTLTGTDYGFDFDPTTDVIRIVSDTEENFRVDPVTGAIISLDTALDPGELTAAGYDGNFAGASATTLFGIDTASNMLVRQGGVGGSPSPNDGDITPIGALGVDPTSVAGFDLASGSDAAFATFTDGTTPMFYGVNLTTGAATLIGTIGDGSLVIRGMAIATPTLQFSSANYVVTERARFVAVVVTRTGGSRGFVTVNLATSNDSASSGSDYGAINQILTFADGETQKRVLIPLFDDRLREGNESVNLALTNPTAAVVLGAQDTAVLTILDNDWRVRRRRRR